MTKYDPLHAFLKEQHGDEITVSFGELEQIIGVRLASSAYHDRLWWANTRNEMQVQTYAWLDAGWKVDTVNLAEEQVRFIRIGRRN